MSDCRRKVIDKKMAINIVINHLNVKFKNKKEEEAFVEYFTSLTINEMLRPVMLRMSEQGYNNGQIAIKLRLTKDTVRYHLRNIEMFRQN